MNIILAMAIIPTIIIWSILHPIATFNTFVKDQQSVYLPAENCYLQFKNKSSKELEISSFELRVEKGYSHLYINGKLADEEVETVCEKIREKEKFQLQEKYKWSDKWRDVEKSTLLEFN